MKDHKAILENHIENILRFSLDNFESPISEKVRAEWCFLWKEYLADFDAAKNDGFEPLLANLGVREEALIQRVNDVPDEFWEWSTAMKEELRKKQFQDENKVLH